MIWGKLLRWRVALLAMLVLAIPIPATALLVRPILMDLKSSGSNTMGSFEVVNDRNRPITVEITVNRLAIPERGDVTLTPDDGADFQIFPPIAAVQPGKRQIFRVKWIGAPDIPQSQFYMFSTSELPVKRNPEDEVTGVEILYAIQSVVAVGPTGQKPRISIEKVERASAKDGRTGVEITFSNDGAAHGFVNSGQVMLDTKGGGWSKTVGEADVSNAFGLGVVPPHQRRVMFLPVADVPATGELTADFRPIRSPTKDAP